VQQNLKLKPVGAAFCDGMYFPRTELTDTIEDVKHLFEDNAVGLVARTVKPSMDEKYWFVKLCEDSAPELHIVK
jgi:hypothetical protein